MKYDVFYYTLTGNIKRFLEKCGVEGKLITEHIPDKPYILVTNTLGFGAVPDAVAAFLEKHADLMHAVCASGHRNWGTNFAKSADFISEKYNVPVLLKFELSGEEEDVKTFIKKKEEMENNEYKTY